MKDYLAQIRMFACLTGAMLLLVSCDEPARVSTQPQVVRKKFVAQADRTTPTPQPVASASSGPASSVMAPKPLVAEHKPQEAPAPAPAPAPAAPIRKPKEPAPPTMTVEATPAPSSSTAGPLQPVMVVQKAALLPAAQANMPTPEARKPEGAIKASEAQIAALLNIQAPPPYSANGKVDPFDPLLRDDSAQADVAKLLRKKRDPQSPLEKIDLGQLKLVAIISAASGNRALVEESSGKGYIIKEGTYVGMNSGKVVGIAIDKILIEEEFEDIYGKTITQKKEITLPKPPGEL